jgi:two-component system response regulator FixJ
MYPEATVFVVDDDEAVRRAIAKLFKSVDLRAELFESAEDFPSRFQPDLLGCLVLDIRMPGIGGLALQEKLAACKSALPIIFVTGHGDVTTAVRAMKAHAFDFIEKPFVDQDLLDKVRDAIDFHIRHRRKEKRRNEIALRINALTPREREIMEMIVDGKSNKVIAAELRISEKTVQTHRTRIMDKMQARSVGSLAKMILQDGPQERRAVQVTRNIK